MARREKEMNKEEEEQPSYWGTLEELLLACAVSRHGSDSWDSVSAELRSRTSHQHHYYYTPANCRRRYIHLRRLFAGADVVAELRRLRIEELRREVQKHDVSIEFLQLKVKRLEEEREGTDLSTEHVIIKTAGVSPEETVSGDGSEGRSLNESNPTTNPKDEPDTKVVKPDLKPVKPIESEQTDSMEKREEYERDGDEVPLAAKQIAIKCQPLIKILAILRSHKHGSVFEHRLRSQESEKYKKMIRQHTNLQTIQRRLDKGFYLRSRPKFFRDLLLLFTNALIFFPNNSNEYLAASELRKLAITHMTKPIRKSDETKTQPKPIRAPSPPIVVCRRRSSNGTQNSVPVAKSTKEAELKAKMKISKFDAKAKERVIVKKPTKSNNNTKKPLVSSDEETEDDDELIMRGQNKKDNKNGKRGGSSKMGKKGRFGKESPPAEGGGRGGKRGREGGGVAAVEDVGRARKRLRR